MTKGAYNVEEGNRDAPRTDSSYKSFICALLIFMTFCLIILLASIKWTGRIEEPYQKEHNQDNDVEVLEHRGNEPTRSKDKLVLITIPTTTSRTTLMQKFTSRPTEKEVVTITTQNATKPTTGIPKSTTVKIHHNDDYFNKSSGFEEISGLFETTISTEQNSDNFNKSNNNEQSINVFDKTTEAVFLTHPTTTDSSDFTSPIYNRLQTHSDIPRIEQATEELFLASSTSDKDITTTTLDNSPTGFPSTTDETTASEEPMDATTTVEESPSTIKTTSITTIPPPLPSTVSTTNATPFSTSAITTTTTTTTVTEPTKSTVIIVEEALPANITTTSTSKTTHPSQSTPTTRFFTKTDTTTISARTATPTYDPDEDVLMEQETAMIQNITRESSGTTPTSSTPKISSGPVCHSSACYSATSRILSLMNHSASPCEDFYTFACGGVQLWQESAESTQSDILSTHLNGANNPSSEYFKEFYQGCIQHEDSFEYHHRIQTVRDLLKDVGEFFSKHQSPSIDLTELFAQLLLRQSMPLFDIGIDVNKQSSDLILQLTLPQESSLQLGLERWSALNLHKERCLRRQQDLMQGTYLNLNQGYESYLACQKNHGEYMNSIEYVVRELWTYSNLSSEDMFKEIKEIRFCIELDVLDHLDSLPAPAETRMKYVKKEYDVRKVSDLQAHYPILRWKYLLETLTGHSVHNNTIVQVYFGQYFTKLFNALANVDSRKLNNAFLAIYANDLFSNTVISHAQDKRHEFCLDLAKRLLPDVWASLAKFYHGDSERKYQNRIYNELFSILMDKFSKSLQNADWADDNLKIKIKQKTDKLNLELFTEPDANRLLNSYHSLNLTGNYQRDLVSLMIHHRRSIYSLEGTPLSNETIFSHFLDPLGSKLLSIYSTGTIAVPMGLARKAPEGLPNYLIMARIGLHLAREIARHFDPTGLTYGLKINGAIKGVLSQLITGTDEAMAYSSPRIFGYHNISFKMNGHLLSTNEKIVDNTAFRLISDSLNLFDGDVQLPWVSASYRPEILFFIASAQEYCQPTTLSEFMVQLFEQTSLPAALKVENIVGNSKLFAEKFQCPDGSSMTLVNDKLQFPYLNWNSEEYYDENDGLYKNK